MDAMMAVCQVVLKGALLADWMDFQQVGLKVEPQDWQVVKLVDKMVVMKADKLEKWIADNSVEKMDLLLVDHLVVQRADTRERQKVGKLVAMLVECLVVRLVARQENLKDMNQVDCLAADWVGNLA